MRACRSPAPGRAAGSWSYSSGIPASGSTATARAEAQYRPDGAAPTRAAQLGPVARESDLGRARELAGGCGGRGSRPRGPAGNDRNTLELAPYAALVGLALVLWLLLGRRALAADSTRPYHGRTHETAGSSGPRRRRRPLRRRRCRGSGRHRGLDRLRADARQQPALAADPDRPRQRRRAWAGSSPSTCGASTPTSGAGSSRTRLRSTGRST